MAQTVVIDITARFTDETSKGLGKAKQSSDKLGDSLRRTQQQADKLGKSKSELSLKDKATQVIDKVSKNLKSITSKAWNLTVKVLDKATAPIRGIFNLLKNPIVQAGAVIGVTIGVKDTIDTFGNFEQAMADVKAIIQNGKDYKEEDFKKLESKGMELGETTVFSATEAAQGMKYLAQNGWSSTAIENSMPAALDLSAAGQTDLATTTNILASTMSPFGLDANKDKDIAGHVADVFAATASGTSTSIEQLGETMKYAAPIAKEFGLSIEDASGLAGIMANGGIRDSMAGTTIRGSLSKMANPTKGGQVWLDKLDLSFTKKNGNMKDMSKIVKDVDKAFQNLSESERITAANEIFGQRAATGWLGVIGQGSQKVNDFADSLYNCDGAAKKMAETQLDTLQGSFKLVQSAAEGAKIRIGKRLAPTLKDFTNWITSKIPVVEKCIGKFTDKFIDKINDIRKLVESDKWNEAPDIFSKIKIAWNEIIEEPFIEWWSGSGKVFIKDVAEKIGKGLGEFYNGGISFLLGLTDSAGDGASVGKAFADGFIEGFKPDEIGKKILDALKSVFKHSYLNPFGEDKDVLSTAVSGLIVGKAAGGIGSLAMGGLNMLALGKIIFGSGLGAASTAGAGTATVGGGILGSATSMTGLLGLGSSTAIALGGGNLAGGASLSAGALSALGLGAIASIASTTAGTVSALNDIKDSFSTYRKKDRLDKLSQAGTKGGMIAAGAGIGALAGSIIPGVGNLIGGILGALFAGNSVGKGISDIIDGTAQIRKMSDALGEASKNLDKVFSKDFTVNGLVDEYRQLNSLITDGKTSVEDRTNAELRQKEIVQQLHDIYPNIITQYDVGLGKLSDQLDTIIEISAIDKEIAISKLEAEIQKGKENLPQIEQNLEKSDKELEEMYLKKNNINKYMPEISSFHNEFEKIKKEKELATVQNNPEMISQADKKLEDLRLRVNTAFEKIYSTNEQGYYDVTKLGINGTYPRLQDFEEAFINEYTKLQSEYTDFLEAYSAEIENNKDIQNKLVGIVEAQQEITEQKLGMPIKDAAKNFYMLDDSQKDMFIESITNLKEFADGLDGLPQEKKIEIDMLFNVRKKATEGPEPIKTGMFPTAGATNNLNLNNLGISNIFPQPHATGGILTKPHVGLVAEAGPEAIIPLSGANKEHGISLWQRAGQMLGLLSNDGIEKHAQGGIFGNISSLKNNSSNKNNIHDMLENLRNNSEASDNKSQNAIQNNNPISINLGGINFTFNGTSPTDKDSIMQTIREQMPEIADDVAQAIAEKLKKLFPNMKAGLI